MASRLSQAEISDFDSLIEQLMKCIPVTEAEVKMICDKVQ